MIAIARTAFETERLIQAAFEAQARCLAAHRANSTRWEAEDRAKAQGEFGKQQGELESLVAPCGAYQKEEQEKIEAGETAAEQSFKVGDRDDERMLRLVRSYSLNPSPAFRIEVKVWSSDEVPRTEAKMGMMVDLGLPEFLQKEPECSPATASTPSPSERRSASTERAQADAVSASPTPTRSPSQRLLVALARAQAVTAALTNPPPPSQLILESLSRAQKQAQEVREAQRDLRALLEEMKHRCERMEKLMAKDNQDPERSINMIAIARTAFETECLIQAAFEAQARCLEAHRADAIRWEAEANVKARGASGEQKVEPEALLALEKDEEKVEGDKTAKVDDSAQLRLVRSYSLIPSPAFRIEVRVWSSNEVPQAEARIGMMVDLCPSEGSPDTSSTPSPSERLSTSTERAQAEALSASPAPTRSPSQRLLKALARAQAVTAAPTCAPPPSQLILESLSRAQNGSEKVRNAQLHLRALLEGMKQRCERLEKLMAKENEDSERLLKLHLDRNIKFAYPHLLSY
ncbi:unnamed protein product [Caenorhabditis brenneri]